MPHGGCSLLLACPADPPGRAFFFNGAGWLSARSTPHQFNWQLAGFAEVNKASLAHSGWSMKGLRLPWKL